MGAIESMCNANMKCIVFNGGFFCMCSVEGIVHFCFVILLFVLLIVLQEFRAFELLRSGADRAEYLLIKEAKIIAMTCTHAALKRRDLVSVGFKVTGYFNVFMV